MASRRSAQIESSSAWRGPCHGCCLVFVGQSSVRAEIDRWSYGSRFSATVTCRDGHTATGRVALGTPNLTMLPGATARGNISAIKGATSPVGGSVLGTERWSRRA